jgi:hypothetical protein
LGCPMVNRDLAAAKLAELAARVAHVRSRCPERNVPNFLVLRFLSPRVVAPMV